MRLRLFLAVFLLAAARGGAVDLASSTAAVERIRGHRFLRPVVVRTIQRGDIGIFLRQQLVKSGDGSLDDYIAALHALQLVDDPNRAASRLMEMYESQVLAAYDPIDHVYYSISGLPHGSGLAEGPLLEQAVEVHELTHALQDQLFQAGHRLLATRGDWDRQMAYQSVLEGEATLVMFAWLSAKTGTNLDAMLADDRLVRELTAALAAGEKSAPDVPPYFLASLAFPYVEGVRYVANVYRRGGWKAVDDIDSNPPVTTAEIMGLPAARGPLPQGLSANDGASGRGGPDEVLDTSLGAFHWRFLLGDAILNGLRGDRVTVELDAACHPTTVVRTAWSSEAAAERFESAYRDFLATRGIRVDCRADHQLVRCSYKCD
jgi:hypothetical protein